MGNSITFVTLVIIAAVTFAASDEAKVNYEEGRARLEALQTLTDNIFTGLKRIIQSDNPEIGAHLEPKFDSAAARVNAKIEIVRQAVADRMVTEVHKEMLVDEIPTIMKDFMSEISPEAEQLSPTATKKIDDLVTEQFNLYRDSTNEKAKSTAVMKPVAFFCKLAVFLVIFL